MPVPVPLKPSLARSSYAIAYLIRGMAVLEVEEL
jgi:hypothetical protein